MAVTAGSAHADTIDFESSANGFGTNTFEGLTLNEDILVIENFGARGGDQSGKVAQQATLPFGGDTDIFRLLGFDTNGAVVADSGTLSNSSAINVGIAAAGIATFSLSIADQPDNGGSSVSDNVRFDIETTVVPLPATLPLVGLGLFSFGLATRSRSKPRVKALCGA